ncbi:hypothetical protein V4R08_05145 [Nitrobacter sp. NHB1]|uniref:hypothetical protein n=1 Tax=Nitrobacter sp. NHB1 TaxID=3119830 RepID=UPI0030008D1C
MTFDPVSSRHINDFYQAIAPWESGYANNSFAYVAVKHAGQFVIVQGIIWLHTAHSKMSFKMFKSENVRAGHFKLSDLGKSYRDMVTDIGNRTVSTPQGELTFPPKHKASYTPLHPLALQSQSRVNVLRLTGDKQILSAGPSVLDWELRSAAVPHDSMQELFSEYGLGGLFTDSITIEVIGAAVMGFDGDNSKIVGQTAHVVIRLANTLDVLGASLGYREINQVKINRGVLTGNEFSWKQTDDMQIGTFDLPVSKAAILHCYAIYKGVAQTHWYISDPTTSQNSRREIIESFDSGLAILKTFLSRPHSRGHDARDFEIAVAWLFWMLGFGTVQMGLTARTQDFADLILTTPQGQIAILECTTGLLRADNKLPKLVARYSKVRERLDQSNNGHVKLLPVMVSTLPRGELQADLEQAEKLGVLVLAKEELDQIIIRTSFAGNNPDEVFSEAERRVRTAQEALTATPVEPELPL